MHLLDLVRTRLARHRIDMKPKTIEQYIATVNVFSRWLGEPSTTEHLTDEYILDLMSSMRRQKRSIATINKKRQMLISIWAHAQKYELIRQDPPNTRRVPRLKDPKKNPTSWTERDIEKLLKACDTFPETRGFGGAQWKALILICYDTGERIGALLETPVRNLDLESGTLIVDAEARKTDEDMVHFIHPQTINAIRVAGLNSPNDKLISWPCSRRYLSWRFGDLLDHAGLPNGRKDKFHRLRRTGYTIMYVRGNGLEAAKAYAGHKTDMSAFYLDRTKLPVAKSVELLPRPAI